MWWFLNEKDKLQHVLAGIVLSQVLVLILSFCTISIYYPLILSFIISTGVSYGKELLYDRVLGRGVYNMKDFIASEIGVLYGLLTSLILLLI
jgi:hypothetical protein